MSLYELLYLYFVYNGCTVISILSCVSQPGAQNSRLFCDVTHLWIERGPQPRPCRSDRSEDLSRQQHHPRLLSLAEYFFPCSWLLGFCLFGTIMATVFCERWTFGVGFHPSIIEVWEQRVVAGSSFFFFFGAFTSRVFLYVTKFTYGLAIFIPWCVGDLFVALWLSYRRAYVGGGVLKMIVFISITFT